MLQHPKHHPYIHPCQFIPALFLIPVQYQSFPKLFPHNVRRPSSNACLNTFVSKHLSVRLQHETRSSPAPGVCPYHKTCLSLAINMFVCSVVSIWRRVIKTVLSLATNTFIWSEKSYSEVGSKNCDKHVRLLLEIGLKPPPKRTNTREKGSQCFPH